MTVNETPTCRSFGEAAVTSKDTFIIRNVRAGSSASTSTVTLPSGRRVHSLDRGVFERAVRAAEKFIDERSRHRDDPSESASPVRHERAAG
jgi:hypothetical protein